MATESLHNPWFVDSVKEFTYLCCPECVFRTKEEQTFETHAIQNHPKSQVLYTNAKLEHMDLDGEVVKEEPFEDYKEEDKSLMSLESHSGVIIESFQGHQKVIPESPESHSGVIGKSYKIHPKVKLESSNCHT